MRLHCSPMILLALATWELVSCGQKPVAPLATVPGGSAEGFSLAGISYNFHVRPILSDKCFACHGPDPAHRKAGLRLDKAEDAMAVLKESPGHAIVPGQPESSAVWQRVENIDPAVVMPPPESHLVLTDGEKAILRRWISEGAKYEPHWAFQDLPKVVAVPLVKHPERACHPIDRFVLSRLEREGIELSPEAEPARWLRRVTLDLTGLPPTPEEVKNFEDFTSRDPEKAREAAVDRLLASPAYGEHMAVAWLDGARYADSFGYQSDQLNTQWPWRDWVIRAFNENLPYDQFITWQLAGDLLPGATRDQILATAFSRNHRLTNEGGSIAEEWKVENAADRVHTFGTVMLGLTLECARCHDHKYDPIPAKDYYSLMAFFNSIDENGLYDHPTKVPAPSLLLPTPEQEARRADASLAWKEAWQKAKNCRDDDGQAAWVAAGHPVEAWPDLLARFSCDEATGSPANSVEGSPIKAKADGLESVEGFAGRALKLDGDHGLVVPGLPKFDRWQPFSVGFRMKTATMDSGRQVLVHQSHGTDVGYNGFDLMLDHGQLEARLYRVWPGNGFGIRTDARVEPGAWTHVLVTYDGSDQAGGFRIWIDGKEAVATVLRDHIWKSAGPATYGPGHLTFGERFRDRGFKDGLLDDIAIFSRNVTAWEAQQLFAGGVALVAADFAGASEDDVRAFHASALSAPVRAARAKATEALKSLVGTEEPVSEVAVMEEMKEPAPTWILARGDYHSPRTDENRVQRNTFSEMLPPFPDDQPRDRLGLARWLTHADHPLTARVMVNRIWAGFFGRGLVSTPENFGLQGALPSHPELLDWLARDFVNSGWDIKCLCKSIVLSATYRQTSAHRAELEEKDPENLLLARGPAYRLDAEQIRDSALAISGLLVPEVGGPPVSPYQPGKDLWKESNSMSPSYRQGKGKELHRRSVYSVWKRTVPLPNMLAFDAGTREVCSVQRSRTNTPLQALVLLNDVQFLEAARALALRMRADAGDDPARLEAGFLRATGHGPDERESRLLEEMLKEQREIFRAGGDGADAGKLLTAARATPDELAAADAVEAAAWIVVAQAMLNLDATVWKR